jgi:hypothetical protein
MKTQTKMNEEQELADINLQYLLYGKERQERIMQELKEKVLEW